MDSTALKNVFSKNVKKFRGLRGLTQHELAARTGLSPQTIIRIEGGTIWPSDKTLCKLSDILKIEIFKFFIPSEDAALATDSDDLKAYIGKYIKDIIKFSYDEFMSENKQ